MEELQQQTDAKAQTRRRWQRWRPWLCRLLLAVICLWGFYERVSIRVKPSARHPYGYLFFGDARTSYPRSDAVTFNVHALNLARGRGFGDYLSAFKVRNFIPPGHPMLLGLFYFFMGNRPAVMGWLVAIMGSLVPLLGYLWAREMWNRPVGLITALLLALHNPYIRIGFSLMSEPSVIFTTALAFWLWARCVRRPSRALAVVAGLVFGFSSLVRPSALAFMLTVWPWLALGTGVPRAKRITVAALFLAAALLPTSCWALRNWRVHGKPSLIYTSISARHAWTGAHPQHGPGYYTRTAWHETLWRDPQASEIDRISRLREETRQYIRRDRRTYMKGFLQRMHDLLPRHEGRTIRWDFEGAGLAKTAAAFLLALFGFARSTRTVAESRTPTGIRRVPGMAWTAAVAPGLVLAIVGTGMYGASDRYRWPLEIILFPFAALAIYSIVRAVTTDLSETFVFSREECRASRFQRALQVGAVILLAAVIGTYACGMSIRRAMECRGGSKVAEVTAADVEAALNESGLADDFAAQVPPWVTYAMVFEEQAANFGEVTSLNGCVVVWWGRVLYPRTSEDGQLSSFLLAINPQPGDFGGNRLRAWVTEARRGIVPPVQEEDRVTVVGRLRYRKAPMADPEIEVFAVLPGRFDGVLSEHQR